MALQFDTTEGAMVTGRVYLDGSIDVEDLTPELFLHYVGVDPFGWNGFAVPMVTGNEFRRFVSAHARNDRNGTWNTEGISEGDGALIYRDTEGNDPDVWSVCAMLDGAPVYALGGWCWSGVAWDSDNRNVFDN